MSSISLDANGDVLRGLKVVETACGAAVALLDEKVDVLEDMDIETRWHPLGVCARLVRRRSPISEPNTRNNITPFNFPAMIPLVVNTTRPCDRQYIHSQASEREPGAAMILAGLCKRAGVAYIFSLPI